MDEEEWYISSHQLELVACSKKKEYDVLTTQGFYYLLPIKVRAYYVADILPGQKNVNLIISE